MLNQIICLYKRYAKSPMVKKVRLRRSSAMNIWRTHAIECDSAKHSIKIFYVPTSNLTISKLRTLKYKKNKYFGVDFHDGYNDESFCPIISDALSILKMLRPLHYKWINENISAIMNAPTFDGNHHYSYSQRTFVLDFFAGGPLKDENDYRLNTTWVAGVLEFFYTQARLYDLCPYSLAADRNRVYDLCLKRARTLMVSANNSVDDHYYDFTALFV